MYFLFEEQLFKIVKLTTDNISFLSNRRSVFRNKILMGHASTVLKKTMYIVFTFDLHSLAWGSGQSFVVPPLGRIEKPRVISPMMTLSKK